VQAVFSSYFGSSTLLVTFSDAALAHDPVFGIGPMCCSRTVQKFSPDGEFLNAFGIKSTGPTHTSIAVAEADDGSVFVADYANHQLQKWRSGKQSLCPTTD